MRHDGVAKEHLVDHLDARGSRSRSIRPTARGVSKPEEMTTSCDLRLSTTQKLLLEAAAEKSERTEDVTTDG